MKKPILLALIAALLLVIVRGANAQVQTTGNLVEMSLVTEDLGGNPINSIAAGSDFLLAVFTQDIRNPPDEPQLLQGIYAAYLNVTFDNTLVALSSGTLPAFSPAFFSYPTASFNAIENGAAETITAGSFQSTIDPSGSNAVQLIFTIELHAASIGSEIFVPSFDSVVGHDILIFDPPTAVPNNQVQFVGATLAIVPEPSSWLMAAWAAAALVVCRSARKNMGVPPINLVRRLFSTL
jgi:hypothetical protein